MRRTRKSPRPALFPALLAGALALPCGCERAERPRSALLVTIDTTRKDALSLYGTHAGVTPGLDLLAREMLVYEEARTAVPLTLPAHASMLTGLYPPRHGLRVNGQRPLPEAAETLAEAASGAGVATAAFVAAVVLAPELGLDQGFERYCVPERRDGGEVFYDERPAGEVVDEALAWLAARDRGRPFLAWIHLFDPHEPYEPPPPFPTHAADRRRRYLGEVSYVDRELTRLFDALRADGTLDEAFVLLCADHGEGLDEHREASHGDYVWESTLRVPFLVRYPDGFRAGERSDELVSVVDVAPTLAEALGLPFPADVDGRSLYRRALPPGRGVYFESYAPFVVYGWSPVTGWLDREGKLVHSARARFFDVRKDPAEARDLSAEVDATAHRAAIAALAERPGLVEAAGEEIDAELRARIAGLGYAGLEADGRALPAPLAATGLRDPLASLELHERLIRGFSLLSGGRHEEAAAVLAGCAREDPTNPFALEHLATSLIRSERFDEAIDPLQRLLAMGEEAPGTWFNLGVSLVKLGREAEARDAFEKAARLAPDEPRIRAWLERLGG